jgi:hypothetical protein
MTSYNPTVNQCIGSATNQGYRLATKPDSGLPKYIDEPNAHQTDFVLYNDKIKSMVSGSGGLENDLAEGQSNLFVFYAVDNTVDDKTINVLNDLGFLWPDGNDGHYGYMAIDVNKNLELQLMVLEEMKLPHKPFPTHDNAMSMYPLELDSLDDMSRGKKIAELGLNDVLDVKEEHHHIVLDGKAVPMDSLSTPENNGVDRSMSAGMRMTH